MFSEGEEPSRREQKKRETREHLLSAAYDLFLAKGFDATTVEEITQAAGVAKGTFFNYFVSKEEMLGPLAAWRMRRFWQGTGEGLISGAGSATAQVKAFLSALVSHLFPDRDLARRTLALHFCRRPEPRHPPMRLWRTLADLVEKAQAQGEIRADVSASFVARLLLDCGFHVAWEGVGEDKGVNVEDYVDMLLQGLAGPEWRSR